MGQNKLQGKGHPRGGCIRQAVLWKTDALVSAEVHGDEALEIEKQSEEQVS